jgi:hypothetical protein
MPLRQFIYTTCDVSGQRKKIIFSGALLNSHPLLKRFKKIPPTSLISFSLKALAKCSSNITKVITSQCVGKKDYFYQRYLSFFAHLAMKDFKWKTRIIDKDQNYKEHAFLVFFP